MINKILISARTVKLTRCDVTTIFCDDTGNFKSLQRNSCPHRWIVVLGGGINVAFKIRINGEDGDVHPHRVLGQSWYDQGVVWVKDSSTLLH